MQGGFPTATPPKRSGLGIVALLLSLAGCVVFPFLAVALGLVLNRSNSAFPAIIVALGLGAATVIAAAVLAIVCLARGTSRTPAIIALVLSVVSLPVGAFAGFWAVLFAAGGGAHGRPFRAGGRAHRTPTAPGETWSAGGIVPETHDLAPEVRSALAEGWTVDASLEHASIAAFSSLALDLVALGAPPSLVGRAHRAALDEVDHARDCFALASAYAGEAIGAGPFPEVRAARATEDEASILRRVAVESAVDGCVGEGTAAAIAQRMAESAIDPVVRAVLGRIARDERSHADLAWDVLVWCSNRGGDRLRDAVRSALEAKAPAGVSPDAELDLSAHGRARAACWSATRESVRLEIRAALDAPARRRTTDAELKNVA